MTPFFETELQGLGFLFLCAVGLGLAALFDGVSALFRGRMRPLGDVLLLLCCAFGLLVALFFLRAGELRLYHWFALLLGAILYLCGIRRAVSFLARRAAALLGKKKQEEKEIL